jgi:RimJ/RimL family protein N-acetyltransferase
MLVPCSIRPYVEADASEMYDAVRESEHNLVPWMPWCHPGYAEHEARAWIRATIDGFSNGTMFDFGVFDERGRYAGGCGVNQVQSASRCANLGYWIRATSCGRGLATAAATRVCRWTFAHTNLNRLEILMSVDNGPSRRVAEKIGAQAEGRLRSRILLPEGPTDAYVYSVVRGDPSSLP